MNAPFDALFGDDAKPFRLTIGGAEAIEETCGAGIPVILRRLAQQECRTKDVREVIRQGLIGGGMTRERAAIELQKHGEDALSRHVPLALIILSRFWLGVEDDPPPKSRPRRAKAGRGKTSEPGGAPSTAPGP